MKLYTFFKQDEKLVLGTFSEGKTRFFFSGFNSAEEAKDATFKLHVELNRDTRPNCPTGIIKAEVEMCLSGEWSKIE